MKTKKVSSVKPRIGKSQSSPSVAPTLEETEVQSIPITSISFNPNNHRKFYSPVALEELAEEIRESCRVIHPITVRTKGDQYELVVGERRLRAATMAGFTSIPAIIRELDDAQVNEIALAENLQREDPHPLNLAYAIGTMQSVGRSLEEIAARLGKSKRYIHSMLCLLNLSEDFQKMFIADAVSLTDAIKIAALSLESQTELFSDYYQDWEQHEDFHINNIDYRISQYSRNLTRAPFSLKDKKLVPESGACIGCKFNSATHKTLFPELDAQPVCSNKSCYVSKCTAHHWATIEEEISKQVPTAFIVDRSPGTLTEKLSAKYPEILIYSYRDIEEVGQPEPPIREDYINDWDDDGEEAERFDEDGYKQALSEYQFELEMFHTGTTEGKIQSGLIIQENTVRSCQYVLADQDASRTSSEKMTAKEVQQAIKEKRATPPMLQSEICRLDDREKRAIELDEMKIQKNIHQQLSQHITNDTNVLTSIDLIAGRFLIYLSLDYKSKSLVRSMLRKDEESVDLHSGELLIEGLSHLTDSEFSQMIRIAIASLSDSNQPHTTSGMLVKAIAEVSGIDVAGIRHMQTDKAEERANRVESRKMDLTKMIEKLNRKNSI